MAGRVLKTLFAMFVLAGATIAAVSQQAPSAPAQKAAAAADLANGKAVYTKACQMCHAADGKGNPAIAKMQKVTLRPLGSAEVLAKTDVQLIKDCTEGIGKMKPVKLTEKDAQDVVGYFRSFKEKDKDKQ